MGRGNGEGEEGNDEGETGKGGNREGETGRGRWGVGDREGDDGEGGNGVGQMERGATGWVRWGGGQWGGGNRKGETGKLANGRGRRRGTRRGGFHRWIEMLGWAGHMECLGGTRLRSFFTLFTRATPGTPASLY